MRRIECKTLIRLLITTKLLWIEDGIVDNKLRLMAKTKKIQQLKISVSVCKLLKFKRFFKKISILD